MKIRAQLVLALFLLAVLPLTGIVLYSYFSSLRAVRQAVREEAAEVTAEMEERIRTVQRDLEAGVERLGRLPLGALLRGHLSEAEQAELTGRMLSEIGDAGAFVDAFELRPLPDAPLPPAAHRPPLPTGKAPAAATLATPEPPAEPLEKELEAIVIKITDDVRAHHLNELHEMLVDPEHGAAIEGARVGLRVAEALAGAFVREKDARTIEEAGRALEEAAAKALEESRRKLEQEIQKERQAERREQRRRIVEERREVRRLFDRDLGVAVREGDRLVGTIQPKISAELLLHQVLSRTRRDQGEIPFALDADGELYVTAEADRKILEDLPLAESGTSGDWLITTSTDADTGLRFGIARPLREPLAAVQRAAARNFAYGLGLIGLALVGILPLSGRMTRNVESLTAGAEKIAAGDLSTRVPVRSRDELGRLARTFNDMAHDLEQHQERLLVEERRRRDQEIEQARLRGEYERKTRELEEAREFQLSLLPKYLPRHPSFEIAVDVRTATEVGGDYYDFHLADDGTLTVAVGDATGHGARAGTMVTVVKSLFSAYASGSGLRRFLVSASRTVRHMDLGRMSMSLVLAELRRGVLTLSSAGMPPALIYRHRQGTVEEVELAGMPLGALEFPYREERLELEPGDTVLLMTDGLPELLGRNREVLGYDRARDLFAAAAARSAPEVVAELGAAVDGWTGSETPNDDVTLVVIKLR